MTIIDNNPASSSSSSSAAAAASATSSATTSRLVYGHQDALFGAIEDMHGLDRSFGHVLDAGTGMHSLRWLASLFYPQQQQQQQQAGGGQEATQREQLQQEHDQRRPSYDRICSITAVTADENMQRQVEREAHALGIGRDCHVVVGNWFPTSTTTNNKNINNKPLSSSSSSSSVRRYPLNMIRNKMSSSTRVAIESHEQFDTILADYLIGAMDGFSPYQQDVIIPLLATRHLKPGGRIYVIGMEPIPDGVDIMSNTFNDPTSTLIGQVRRTRDACILLAGHRCYREYPLNWVRRQVVLARASSLSLLSSFSSSSSSIRTKDATQANDNDDDDGTAAVDDNDNDDDPLLLEFLSARQFPILYRHATIVKQINVGRSKLALIRDNNNNNNNKALAMALQQTLDALEETSLQVIQKQPQQRIACGFDYVVAAERRRR